MKDKEVRSQGKPAKQMEGKRVSTLNTDRRDERDAFAKTRAEAAEHASAFDEPDVEDVEESEAYALVGLLAEPVPPPPELRAKVMERIRLHGDRTRPSPDPARPPLMARRPTHHADNNEKAPPSLARDAALIETLRRHLEAGVKASDAEPPPRRRALLIVDMLHDYVDENAPMLIPNARAIVPALAARLRRERAQGTPILYINDAHSPDDPDFEHWPRHAVRGTQGAEVIPELRPEARDHIVHRVTYSGFFGTDLEERLSQLGCNHLVLTGQAADVCVMMTAVDALMRGFSVEIPEDSVAGLTDEGKAFALRRIALLKPFGSRDKT